MGTGFAMKDMRNKVPLRSWLKRIAVLTLVGSADLRDADYFGLRLFLQRGAPTWPNGFDLAPWALHDDMERENALTRPPRVA